MFSPEQKKYIFDNSVKVDEQSKYIQIMALYETFFEKAKKNSIKRYIEFIVSLLIVLYIVCVIWLSTADSTRVIAIKVSAIFVGTLLAYKIGKSILDYIDDLPIVKKIQQKECDLLCYTGDLNDVTKFINCSASSHL